MSRTRKPKNQKARKPAKERAIVAQAKRFLNDPTNDDIGIDLDEALFNAAIKYDDLAIDRLLNAHSNHPNFQLLIDELDYASSSHLVMSSDHEGLTCKLMTIPVVIVSEKQTCTLSSEAALKIAKSFREHSMISPGTSIMVMPDLLSIDGIHQNHAERKRLLLGMIEVVSGDINPIFFNARRTEQLPALENGKGATLLLRYLNLFVMGTTEELYEDVFSWVEASDSAWNEYVSEIIEKDGNFINALASSPSEYEDSLSDGTLTFSTLAISTFAGMSSAKHAINPEHCSLKLEFSYNDGAMNIFFYYCHAGKALDAEKTTIPLPVDEEHAKRVFDVLADVVLNACQSHGIGAIEMDDGVLQLASH